MNTELKSDIKFSSIVTFIEIALLAVAFALLIGLQTHTWSYEQRMLEECQKAAPDSLEDYKIHAPLEYCAHQVKRWKQIYTQEVDLSRRLIYELQFGKPIGTDKTDIRLGHEIRK